jgi:ABC-type transport system involved in cytochrome c biogenesis permease subunit
MDSGLKFFCFTACYAAALILELPGLWSKVSFRRAACLLAASVGVIVQTAYLGQRVVEMPYVPLASHHDWLLLAAWLLAVIYVGALFYYPRSSLGVFLLPAVLVLVGVAMFADTQPLASFEAPRVWGLAHGVFLLLGTVAVLLGFLAGLMYLVQSHRLKHKLPLAEGLRLPSLEWLERVNSRSLGAAALLVGGGLLTGILSRFAQQGGQGDVPWGDPVVLSLVAMFGWLVVAEAFRLVYPAARQGRKVAYLTIAAFLLLLLMLATVTLRDSLHSTYIAIAPQATSRGGGP